MTQRDRRAYRMVARAEQVEKTRRAILDAMKAALRSSPYPDIRVADVAAAAGVSAQTVHTHFRTKDDLLLAAIAELGPEVLAMRGGPAPGDVAAIVRGIVRVYESTADLNWSLLPLEADSPAIAAVLAMGRAGHRAWLENAFRPPPARRRRGAAAGGRRPVRGHRRRYVEAAAPRPRPVPPPRDVGHRVPRAWRAGTIRNVTGGPPCGC